MTHPSIEIAPGTESRWELPPGPPRILRSAVASVHGERTLTATLDGAGQRRVIARCNVGGDGQWEPWEFEVPALDRPAEIVFRPRQAGRSLAPVDLAQLTLSRPAKKSPVVFIVFDVDTLRKDHLSIYGYERPTTPNIDRYFRKAAIWENAFSNVSWTLPSHVTMFTSTLPNEHGVGGRITEIPPSLPTLAERLQREGYRTIAVTGGGYLDPFWGLERGFDTYEVTSGPAPGLVSLLASRLESAAGEPVFVFFHTYRVHSYIVPRSLKVPFSSYADMGPLADRDVSQSIVQLARGRSADRLRTWLTNRYDASLYDVDRSFPLLTDALAGLGIANRTAILLTSDHGESIFDRPEPSSDVFAKWGHHRTPHLYDEYLRVPFMLRAPWLAARGRRKPAISLVDLSPTILDALGLAPEPTFEGRSVLRSGDQIVVAEDPRYEAVAVRAGDRKMIRRTTGVMQNPVTGTDYGSLPALECFDTGTDPREMHPLPCAAFGRRLSRELERRVASRFPGSLVLRFAGERDGPEKIYLRASARSGGLSVSSFGLAREGHLWSEGPEVRGIFAQTAHRFWIGLQPSVPGDGVSLEIASQDGLAPESLRLVSAVPWASIPVSPTPSAESPLELFRTAAAPWGRSRPMPAALSAKLLSLGYLTGGDDPPVPVHTKNDPAASTSAREIRPGMVSLAVRNRFPAWDVPPAPPPPEITRIDPDSRIVASSRKAPHDERIRLDVYGRNFSSRDRVWWELEWLSTEFVDSHHLRAELPTEYFFPGDFAIYVRDLVDSRQSAPATFHVELAARAARSDGPPAANAGSYTPGR